MSERLYPEYNDPDAMKASDILTGLMVSIDEGMPLPQEIDTEKFKKLKVSRRLIQAYMDGGDTKEMGYLKLKRWERAQKEFKKLERLVVETTGISMDRIDKATEYYIDRQHES